jgi:hypothetical protein
METWRPGDGDMETWRHRNMEMETSNIKTEAQAIFINIFIVCS